MAEMALCDARQRIHTLYHAAKGDLDVPPRRLLLRK